MGVIVAPIREGKLAAWKQWVTELNGTRKEELADFNRRYGLTRHAAWLMESPAGPAVVALHQAPGADSFMPSLGPSQEKFDLSFKEKVKEIHGLDVTQPPPGPPPELYYDSGS